MARVCPPDREIFVGPRGGHYYLTPSGNKVYCRSPVPTVSSPEPAVGVLARLEAEQEYQPKRLGPKPSRLEPIDTYLGSIEISSASTIYQTSLIGELTSMYEDCFHRRVTHLTFLPPSTLFVMASDPGYTNLIASAVVSYANPDHAYIFNVCTRSAYRGRGYMRTLLTTLIDQTQEQYPGLPIYLEVEPNNIPAKRLYESLGFEYISTVKEGRKVYEVMQLL